MPVTPLRQLRNSAHSHGTQKNLHASSPATLLVDVEQAAYADQLSVGELVRDAVKGRLRERRQPDESPFATRVCQRCWKP